MGTFGPSALQAYKEKGLGLGLTNLPLNIFDSADAPFWANIQFTSCTVACEVLQPRVFHPTILPFLRLRFIMSYVDLCVICGRGKAQFDVRNQGQEEEDSM